MQFVALAAAAEAKEQIATQQALGAKHHNA
jgi:hypothetical protein